MTCLGVLLEKCVFLLLGTQAQDAVLRSLNPCAYDYIGLSKKMTDFRVEPENRMYVSQLKALRNLTDVKKFVDEPEDVSVGLRVVVPVHRLEVIVT